MLWLYRLLFLPVLLLASPFYLRRMWRRGGYRENFLDRFGIFHGVPPKAPGIRRVWLQAVSVGEMLAVEPILRALRKEPDVEIFLTTTTSTGYEIAKEKYGELIIGLGYFPIDFRLFSAMAWERIAPDMMILTEGERWPEHLAQAEKRRVPVLAINARISDRSFNRMWRARILVQPLRSGLTHVMACTRQDADRFRALGFAPAKITTTGNIKLDVEIEPLGDAEKTRLRRELGLPEGLILLGSSTWPGEEAALVTAMRRARGTGLACSLLLVPRHAERREEIEAMLKKTHETCHFRSRGPAPGEVAVAVADTTGELRQLTQLADLVFCGKSLPPHTEGQSPIEAAALGKAIVYGPGMANFYSITRKLELCGAARRVPDAAALTASCVELLRDGTKRSALATAAKNWQQANQGAVARTMEIVRAELNEIT